jgi:hypothetical protein
MLVLKSSTAVLQLAVDEVKPVLEDSPFAERDGLSSKLSFRVGNLLTESQQDDDLLSHRLASAIIRLLGVVDTSLEEEWLSQLFLDSSERRETTLSSSSAAINNVGVEAFNKFWEYLLGDK